MFFPKSMDAFKPSLLHQGSFPKHPVWASVTGT